MSKKKKDFYFTSQNIHRALKWDEITQTNRKILIGTIFKRIYLTCEQSQLKKHTKTYYNGVYSYYKN